MHNFLFYFTFYKLSDGVVTDKSDMYSYGLTIFEMLTLNIPHFNFPNEDDFENEDDFNSACEDVEVMAVENFGKLQAFEAVSLQPTYTVHIATPPAWTT